MHSFFQQSNIKIKVNTRATDFTKFVKTCKNFLQLKCIYNLDLRESLYVRISGKATARLFQWTE